MESALAGFAVQKVCDLALQQVSNQVNLVCNFKEDLEWLKNKFVEISSVLDEGEEESSSQKESVKNWLHRVRDVAWEAEDILQELAVDSLYSRYTHVRSFMTCTPLILRLRLGKQIQKVKAQLNSVVSDGKQLNIVRAQTQSQTVQSHRREEAGESSSTSHRSTSVVPTDSKAVDIDSKVESIVSLLQKPETSIVAVVGMGGVGKTFLLQHVYNASKGGYHKSAWLSVSRFYSVSKLQRDLAFQLDEDLCNRIKKSGVSDVLARELISNFMLEKRCLIVLDDVWRAEREDNLLSRLGIPVGGNNQCKLMVSTRSTEVCINLRAEIYEMERLREEESWKLFCAHAFPKCKENRAPEKLEKVARKIEKKCGNLPLAIKVIAASLASTEDLSEWQSIFEKMKKVGTGTSKEYDHVIHILKLSYDSLPPHLKSCFAYFSFFPEDEKIDCEYLMYLWMGEGFILATHNPWDCLHQLANLCLVEVWEDEYEAQLDPSEMSLRKYCRMHDLLLELAIHVSTENKCAFRVENAFSFSRLHSVNTAAVRWCRLFLAKREIEEHAISQMRPDLSHKLVRTLSLSWNTQIGREIPATLLKGMRALRVLDLSQTNISTLPACVGDMKLLKVLNLSYTAIEKIPECVRRLKSLSYLNVYGHLIMKAPKWIGELRCLQHLEGSFHRLPKGIAKVESLRTLRTFLLDLSKHRSMQSGRLSIEDVGNMSQNLEEISFLVSEESQLKRMEEGILAPLKKMRRLTVSNETGLHLPQFPESMAAMRDLEQLKLINFAVPRWICCLTNLRYLFLCGCHCRDYPEFETMPNLVSLRLSENKTCKEMPKAFGKSGGFPHLRFLKIELFTELEEFPEIEDGGMPCLEELEIWICTKLKKGGEGVERLKRLKELDFRGSGNNEWREMYKEGGVYWTTIKSLNPHVAIIV